MRLLGDDTRGRHAQTHIVTSREHDGLRRLRHRTRRNPYVAIHENAFKGRLERSQCPIHGSHIRVQHVHGIDLSRLCPGHDGLDRVLVNIVGQDRSSSPC